MRSVDIVQQMVQSVLSPEEQELLIIKLIGKATPEMIYTIIDDTLELKDWTPLIEKLSQEFE